jgi:hypothetical protein
VSDSNAFPLTTTSNTVTLVVDPPVEVVTQPVGGLAYVGGDFTLTVMAMGGRGALSYQWQRDGFDVGANSATLDLTGLTLADAGNYTCVVSDEGTSSETSDIAALAVENTMSITAQPVGGSVTEDGQHTFQVSVQDTHGAVTYAWSKDGVVIAGQAGDTCIIDPITISGEGWYTCAVTDDSGTVETNPAFLEVVPLPDMPLSGVTALLLLTAAAGIVRLRRGTGK